MKAASDLLDNLEDSVSSAVTYSTGVDLHDLYSEDILSDVYWCVSKYDYGSFYNSMYDGLNGVKEDSQYYRRQGRYEPSQ